MNLKGYLAEYKSNSNINTYNIFKKLYMFIPLVIFYFALIITYNFLFFDVIKFAGFQILFILLPGYFFSKVLITAELTISEKMILGYPVSIIVLFLLSLVGRFLGFKYLPIIILFFSFVSVYKIFEELKNKEAKQYNSSGDENLLLISILYCCCTAIFFFIFTLSVQPPTIINPGIYYQDSLWTVGNTWSYIRYMDNLPLWDARFKGISFSYHMLQNIYQANIYIFTGITPFKIHFYLEPLFDWFFIITFLVIGGKKIGGLSNGQIIFFSLLLLFTTTSGKIFDSLPSHFYFNPLSLFFGFPAFLMFIFYFYSYFGKQGGNKLDLIYVSILFCMISATKGILMAIIPLSFLILYIVKVLKKQATLKEFLLGVCFLVVILILGVTIFNNMDGSKHPIRDSVDYLVVKFYYTTCMKIFGQISVLLFLFVIIDRLDERKYFGYFVLIFILVSMAFVVMVSLRGGGVYPFWYSQILIYFLLAIAFDYIYKSKKVVFKIFTVVTICIGFYNFGEYIYKNGVTSGWYNEKTFNRLNGDPRITIDKYEWDAMNWLNDNVSYKKVFFSDRKNFNYGIIPSSEELGRFFGYSAISGLQGFAEGDDFMGAKGSVNRKKAENRWDLIDSFLYGNSDIKVQSMSKIDADYFIQSLRFNKIDYSLIPDLKLVFSNQSIKIYQKM